MKYRQLGKSGLEVSAIGLGGMAMTSLYGEVDQGECTKTVHAAIAAGLNFIDSSDAYADGRNEEFLGQAIKGKREKVVISTKFGNMRYPDGSRGAIGKPEYVIKACEKSLARLGVEAIDLYYQHRVDPDAPIEETVGAMARLVEAGKVRHLGLSEKAPATIRRAHATHPIAAVQTEYSLFTRFVEAEHLALCRELGIGWVAYSPLGRGILAGAIRTTDSLEENDSRRSMPRYAAATIDRNLALMKPLEDIAAEKGPNPGQVALAWLFAQGDDIAPIPGTKRRTQMAENLAAVDLDLSEDEARSLGDAIAAEDVEGERYGPDEGPGPIGALAPSSFNRLRVRNV